MRVSYYARFGCHLSRWRNQTAADGFAATITSQWRATLEAQLAPHFRAGTLSYDEIPTATLKAGRLSGSGLMDIDPRVVVTGDTLVWDLDQLASFVDSLASTTLRTLARAALAGQSQVEIHEWILKPRSTGSWSTERETL